MHWLFLIWRATPNSSFCSFRSFQTSSFTPNILNPLITRTPPRRSPLSISIPSIFFPILPVLARLEVVPSVSTARLRLSRQLLPGLFFSTSTRLPQNFAPIRHRPFSRPIPRAFFRVTMASDSSDDDRPLARHNGNGTPPFIQLFSPFRLCADSYLASPLRATHRLSGVAYVASSSPWHPRKPSYTRRCLHIYNVTDYECVCRQLHPQRQCHGHRCACHQRQEKISHVDLETGLQGRVG